MNEWFAAHKDELERLLVNLSGNTAVSGARFVARLDRYFTRLDTNCSDISARFSLPPLSRKRGTNDQKALSHAACCRLLTYLRNKANRTIRT
jgi:hypothetical protein